MGHPHGSFNVILYTDKGRAEVIRRTTLKHAIQTAERHAASNVGYYASIVRVTDGKNVGLALSTPSGNRKGEFRFA